MSNFISKDKYEKIIAPSPTTMKLPIYIGESNDGPFYLDLTKEKSIAMYGKCGISAICSTSLFSMIKAREHILRQNYFICISCKRGYYDWNIKDIPFADEYITDTCTAVYDLVHYFNSVKNTLSKLSTMSEDERKDSGYIFSYQEYVKYLAKHPRIYIFEGYQGPLAKGILDNCGLNFNTIKEVFKNAYKFHIYILIPNCIRDKNELAESIHTSINIERTNKCYYAKIVKNKQVVKDHIHMVWYNETFKVKNNV